MNNIDFIIIAQSEVTDYDHYASLPLERIELFSNLIYPRMVHYKGQFLSHLDLLNYLSGGQRFDQADCPRRRELLNIWNLSSFSGIHLASYLLQSDIHTRVINNIDAEWDRFCDAYGQGDQRPLVGISSTFMLSYNPIKRLVKRLREIDSHMQIVIGGAFANQQFSNEPAALKKTIIKYNIDYVLHALNSEADLRDLILAPKTNSGIEQVYNLLYHDAEKPNCVMQNRVQWHDPVLGDMSVFWDCLGTDHVGSTVQMRTSSGCPFSCAFCSYPQTARGFHAMDLDLVERQLENVLMIPGVDRIIFIDDTLNVPPKRFRRLCRMFAKYDFEWFSFLRAQFVDSQTAGLMRDSGCKAVYLGIESANDQMLRHMNKKTCRADVAKGLAFLKNNEITTLGAFIIGFPGETQESIRDNIDFIQSEGLDFYTLKEFYFIKNTPVYHDRELYGLTGTGSDWKHHSMDYNAAYKAKIEIFKTIKNSVFVDPDINLWYLAYMYDRGFGMDTIKEIQKYINLIMADQISGTFSDEHRGFEQLRLKLAAQTVHA